MGIEKFILTGNETVLEAMGILNKNGRGIAFICQDGKLNGVVTDGDIRRYILQNGNLNINIKLIANQKPKFLLSGELHNYTFYMKKEKISAVPIVNAKGQIIRIEFIDRDSIYKNEHLKIPVVIMAGGKGSRLFPFTSILPKPLIPIGEKTILERIIDNFQKFGCEYFNIIVNYKRDLIKAYVKEAGYQAQIDFTEEKTFLGTGGGLKLLQGKIKETFFMTNCDILIDEDYSEILKYHRANKHMITLVCAMKNITIPYGTLKMNEDGKIKELKEKPEFSFMTNTGLYMIEPGFLELIPCDTFIHITELVQLCLDKGLSVGVYPVSEHAWMDMGQLDELEKMKKNLGGL